MPSNIHYLYTKLCQKRKTKGKKSRRFYLPDLIHNKRHAHSIFSSMSNLVFLFQPFIVATRLTSPTTWLLLYSCKSQDAWLRPLCNQMCDDTVVGGYSYRVCSCPVHIFCLGKVVSLVYKSKACISNKHIYYIQWKFQTCEIPQFIKQVGQQNPTNSAVCGKIHLYLQTIKWECVSMSFVAYLDESFNHLQLGLHIQRHKMV